MTIWATYGLQQTGEGRKKETTIQSAFLDCVGQERINFTVYIESSASEFSTG